MNTILIALLAILSLSALVAVVLALKKPVETPVKVMLFVGYFWGTAFVQFLIVSVVYWWAKHQGYHWFL